MLCSDIQNGESRVVADDARFGDGGAAIRLAAADSVKRRPVEQPQGASRRMPPRPRDGDTALGGQPSRHVRNHLELLA